MSRHDFINNWAENQADNVDGRDLNDFPCNVELYFICENPFRQHKKKFSF